MTHAEDIVSYIGTIWDFIQGKNEAEIREIILQDAQMQERPEWLLANVDEIAREAAREVEA